MNAFIVSDLPLPDSPYNKVALPSVILACNNSLSRPYAHICSAMSKYLVIYSMGTKHSSRQPYLFKSEYPLLTIFVLRLSSGVTVFNSMLYYFSIFCTTLSRILLNNFSTVSDFIKSFSFSMTCLLLRWLIFISSMSISSSNILSTMLLTIYLVSLYSMFILVPCLYFM